MVECAAVIRRERHIRSIQNLFRTFPVVALLGARQVGKTTLARALADSETEDCHVFDLERQQDVARLQQPELALAPLRGLVVLDEIQRRPDLFPALRVLADRPDRPARFLVLGSASPGLLRQSSETLAGRIAYHDLPGFDLAETGADRWEQLWLRGCFPRSFLADDAAASVRWRREFVRTYLEQELPDLGIQIPPGTIRRFWTMLAHYHGQHWNAAELGRAFGVSEKTVRNYLDLLCATFLAIRLRPFHVNLQKREVKAPKVYVADSGVLHTLLDLETRDEVLSHPKVGASFEGFAIGQVCRQLHATDTECYFWGVHTGAELDLLVVRGQRRLGFEIKFTEAPEVTPAMRSALATLGLERLDVVYPGRATFPLGDRMRAVGIADLQSAVEPLRP